MPQGKQNLVVGNLTNAQRLEICRQKDQNPRVTQTALAAWAKDKFNLAKAPTQATISHVLSKKRQYEAMGASELDAKRPRMATCQQLDTALANWVFQCQARGVAISSDLIKAKGKAFSEQLNLTDKAPEFSNGWLESFQKRYGLKAHVLHGESGSADTAAIETSMPRIRGRLSKYSLKDIYNMDETGLFYRMAPDRTIAQRQIEGSKKDKSRLTIALAANADGSHKIKPFIIGHACKPRAFQKKTGEQLGFYYRANAKAWMTGVLFQEWLRKMDGTMRSANRKVLLLLDNAPAHFMPNEELSNVELLMLPPNTTSKIQPMDAGIIAAFKRRYRRFQLHDALDKDAEGEADIYHVDQLTAMKWYEAAWKDITPATIANCFRHTGLWPKDERARESHAPEHSVESAIDQELAVAIECLHLRHPMTIKYFLNPVEEQQNVHQLLTDEDLLALAAPEPPADAEESNEDITVEHVASRKDKLRIIRSTIQLLDVSKPKHAALHRSLREFQQEIENEGKTRQLTLDRFLKPASRNS